MCKDAMYEEICKRRDDNKSREEALAVSALYSELEATLDDDQKALLQRYSTAFGKFMIGVCDTAYVHGFENGKKSEC